MAPARCTTCSACSLHIWDSELTQKTCFVPPGSRTHVPAASISLCQTAEVSLPVEYFIPLLCVVSTVFSFAFGSWRPWPETHGHPCSCRGKFIYFCSSMKRREPPNKSLPNPDKHPRIDVRNEAEKERGQGDVHETLISFNELKGTQP